MEARCLETSRAMVLHVLQEELGVRATYMPSPDFCYCVGSFTLTRNGRLTWDPNGEWQRVLAVLAGLGLVDYPHCSLIPTGESVAFSTTGHSGRSLLNLMCMISCRQRSLNRALNVRKAFWVDPMLMKALVAHPSPTIAGFLQALYGWQDYYQGVCFSLDSIVLSGFDQAPAAERHIHLQLANLMVAAALNKSWCKPIAQNMRNQKYAFRTWLNALGMIGPEYEEARATMLGRLYGRSDQRRMPRTLGGERHD